MFRSASVRPSVGRRSARLISLIIRKETANFIVYCPAPLLHDGFWQWDEEATSIRSCHLDQTTCEKLRIVCQLTCGANLLNFLMRKVAVRKPSRSFSKRLKPASSTKKPGSRIVKNASTSLFTCEFVLIKINFYLLDSTKVDERIACMIN